ncbi:sterol desaturase family protein [Methylomonas sp. DH-1]|uniref:sterol desaturase family protein n=1 Tax=Methylomonas sp. (strain DH-1) TaxID=1727196 RepID=UPI0007C94356|nr:sterol desaturase family protein [Methylomonas sp. DH-1]ANE54152.1 hypothetical protein AYM39_02400 [Methylomonas sp. DH-1]
MATAALQIACALLYANLGEWLMHKYLLHGLGKNPGSIWAYHWYEHHRVCAEHGMLDPGYRSLKWAWNAQSKELAVLAGIVTLHLPLLFYLPFFVMALYAALALYYYKHRRAHLDPEWAKRHLPWHYQHHLRAGNGNWCVTWPWFDYLFGTRIQSPENRTGP